MITQDKVREMKAKYFRSHSLNIYVFFYEISPNQMIYVIVTNCSIFWIDSANSAKCTVLVINQLNVSFVVRFVRFFVYFFFFFLIILVLFYIWCFPILYCLSSITFECFFSKWLWFIANHSHRFDSKKKSKKITNIKQRCEYFKKLADCLKQW